MNFAENDVKFVKIETAVAVTAMKSIERTYEKLPTPLNLDVKEDLNHSIIDSADNTNKDECIHRLKNFLRW